MGKKLHHKVGLFILIAFCLGKVSSASAQIPPESFKILAIQEKEILVSAVLSYKNKRFELDQDILKLKSDKEWVSVKMMRIQGHGRSVPWELTRSQDSLGYKIKTLGVESGRMADLTGKHLESLRQLDSKVKKNNKNRVPEWWTLETWVLKLMYPGKKHYVQAGNKKYSATDVSSLMQDLKGKIKAVELENWVALFSEENGIRLEVQLPILFGSGKSSVAKDYKKFFRKLSWLLKSYSVDVEVAGYADGPATKKGKDFKSNIELGSSRAVNVVKELVDTGMPPAVFRIISHGEYGVNGDGVDELSAAMKRRVDVNVYFKENEMSDMNFLPPLH